MKTKILLIPIIILFFFNLRLINRPVTENDEGIYLTTFKLVDRGYKLYKEVFFSQAPGFFLTVYPGYLILGKTLQAARLTVFTIFLISLFGLLWLGKKQKKLEAAILAVLILFSIPTFSYQIITLQSDALALAFSMLSIVSMYRYIDTSGRGWVFMSSFFFTLAFWTKFDVTIMIPIIYLLINYQKRSLASLKSLILFTAIFLITSIMMVIPFGIKEIFNNIFILRNQALLVYPIEPLKVFELLKNNFILSSIIVLGIAGFIFLKPKIYGLTAIFLWSIVSLLSMFVYRPLFPHHLVFLTVPFVLLFSFSVSKYKRLTNILLVIALFFAVINSYQSFVNNSGEILSREQMNLVELIQKYTKPEEFVVADEEILNAVSGRLPPPELADVSFVRIKSGNLSPEKFKAIIHKYKPKLIIARNGRLESMKGFKEIVKDYKFVSTHP